MRLRVFYLDDEVDLCQVFSENFSTPENEISLFSDPAEALAAIKTSPPDLFIVDYRLPGMTGEDVAIKVGSSIPIVLLTGDLELTKSNIFLRRFSKQPFPFDEIGEFLSEMARKKAA
jgi:CheY-like chemotaxis protein